MHAPAQLLQPILAAARRRGLDQAGLARSAGLSPECISRAKRRTSMDLSTLVSLADAAGMEIRVEPRQPPEPTPAPTPKGLADPAWGLAWSNPEGISDTALIRAALRRGNFSVVLQACAEHGVDRVASEWQAMRQQPEPEAGPALVAQVERVLRNIRRGRQHAAA